MAKKKSPVPETAPVATEYTVVARRYRPQQFSDLIGQEHVATALVNALQSGRVAHAYLFTGARGVGKTSAARILAKALNCVKGPTATPCDECDSCKAIAAGEDVDVLEIDGASNNKVDEVRDIRQNVGFRPTRSRYKIYIIDEVHMLSTAAFNALLKTLEEPPPHVKFILATTEVQKIPITILSRCQRFDFAHVGPGKIFEQLKRIVEREGYQADDEALKFIARRAGGSMRDSQSLLDQLLASSSDKLTAEQVNAVLGTAGDERVTQLAAAVFAHDAKSGAPLDRRVGRTRSAGWRTHRATYRLLALAHARELRGAGGTRFTHRAGPKGNSSVASEATEPRRDPRRVGCLDRDERPDARYRSCPSPARNGRRPSRAIGRTALCRATRDRVMSERSGRCRARYKCRARFSNSGRGWRRRKKKRPDSA